MSASVAILAGGTGGHVMPAVAVAEELNRRGARLSWFGRPEGLEAEMAPATGADYHAIGVGGLRGMKFLSRLRNACLLPAACLKARKLLRAMSARPQVAVGFGGYVSVPPALACLWSGIPLVIHEQNAVAGSANRLLSRWAKARLGGQSSSFADADSYVGNPVRSGFAAVRERAAPTGSSELRLLVFGGSQGAAAINELAPAAVERLSRDGAAMQVHHLTGAAMRDSVAAQYRKKGIAAQVQAFSQNMPALYRWADLALCRAGAMTLAELALAGLPTLLIPLPGSIDGHQMANGLLWHKAGAGLCVSQSGQTAQSLSQLLATFTDAAKRRQMSKAAASLARPDAGARIADRILSLAQER